MDWQLIVPGAAELRTTDLRPAREVRLRPGQPVTALLPEGLWRGQHILTPADILRAAQALSGHSLAAHQEALSRGFLPLPGGHRLGVCGEMDEKGRLREITSLCVRLCHQCPGAGAGIYQAVRGKSCLIIGPPGSGKTTLLRDLTRLHGLDGYQTAVADERGEIAACRDGQPLLDVGPQCDVVTGLDKARALPLLIRSMAPQVIATDELGGPGDAAALGEAAQCGVRVLATLHGRSVDDVRWRGMDGLLPLFDVFVLLTAPEKAPQVLTQEDATCKEDSP
ncbi:MAG: stage III sporulation protein AB [Clostridia bacterium]|nr:stage III sporulation protein AB [Clostridia bacterium]